MTVAMRKREKQYRTIYELLWFGNPRIYVKDIASELCVNPRAASRRLKEAHDFGYVSKTQVRKRSHKNTKEFIYFVKSEYPHNLYKEYSENMNVSYHATMGGFADSWIISREKIDIENIEGDVLVEGPRSDFYTSFAPNHPWEKAVKIMWKKAENFSLDDYKQKGIIETKWNETIEWDLQDEALYGYFKHDLRKPFTPVMKEHSISSGKIYKWLERMPECCTFSVRYFPERASSYDPYLFMFETDYEDFIIELFSELPTSSFFFKVSDKLFMYANVSRYSLRRMEPNMSDISQLHITLLVDYLRKRGIIKKGVDSIVKYSCSKDF
jgi:hypothetical protein